jgi:hypothetical protein
LYFDGLHERYFTTRFRCSLKPARGLPAWGQAVF